MEEAKIKAKEDATLKFGKEEKMVKDMVNFLSQRTDKLSAAFRLIDEVSYQFTHPNLS